MKQIEERRETIRQIAEELEALRPRIEAAGGGLRHYAYSKPLAFLKITSIVCVAIAMVAALTIILVTGDRWSGVSGIIFMTIMVPCSAFAAAAYCITDLGKNAYVLASPKTVRALEQVLTKYQEMVEKFEQRQREAEIYRPKFDQLRHIIICELNGVYEPYWRQRDFAIKIGFGQFKAELYNLNQADYAKLLARIIESRSEQGNDQLTEFIQTCEGMLNL